VPRPAAGNTALRTFMVIRAVVGRSSSISCSVAGLFYLLVLRAGDLPGIE